MSISDQNVYIDGIMVTYHFNAENVVGSVTSEELAVDGVAWSYDLSPGVDPTQVPGIISTKMVKVQRGESLEAAVIEPAPAPAPVVVIEAPQDPEPPIVEQAAPAPAEVEAPTPVDPAPVLDAQPSVVDPVLHPDEQLAAQPIEATATA